MHEFCARMEDLLDLYAQAIGPKRPVVLDNLNTHSMGSLYDAFTPEVARKIARRIEFHYTPIHGSWLNVAELELAVLGHGVLKKRIGSIEKLQTEINSTVGERNQRAKPVDWKFSTQIARSKLGKLYPSVT